MIETFEDFVEQCDKKRCPRFTIYNAKTCLRDYKRNDCWIKYNRKLERQLEKMGQKDVLWQEVREQVWIRDAGFFIEDNSEFGNWKDYCRIWKTLTWSERLLLEDTFSADLFAIGSHLDCAHEFGKGAYPEYKYDVDKVFLISRFFHSRLDQYKDLVTGKPMSDKDREGWFRRIKRGSE